MKKMEPKIIMYWVLKIFYGILYRQRFLPMDRRNRTQDKIISPEEMEQFQLLHYLLQGARLPIFFSQLEGEIPASIFVFELQESMDTTLRFDCKYNVYARILYLRMGRVGILASFDAGAQTVEGSEFFSKYQGQRLHPIQFEELGAKFFMKAIKCNRVPKVIFSESPKGIKFMVVPVAGTSMCPVFDPCTKDEMVEMLMFFLDIRER